MGEVKNTYQRKNEVSRERKINKEMITSDSTDENKDLNENKDNSVEQENQKSKQLFEAKSQSLINEDTTDNKEHNITENKKVDIKEKSSIDEDTVNNEKTIVTSKSVENENNKNNVFDFKNTVTIKPNNKSLTFMDHIKKIKDGFFNFFNYKTEIANVPKVQNDNKEIKKEDLIPTNDNLEKDTESIDKSEINKDESINVKIKETNVENNGKMK